MKTINDTTVLALSLTPDAASQGWAILRGIGIRSTELNAGITLSK
jgi:hypothetical protein